MAFRFSVLCDLLTSLERIVSHDPPLLPADRRNRSRREAEAWFKAHRRSIDELDVTSTVALLSSLFPERRTDRVYGIQSASLARALCRPLSLSSAKAFDLQGYSLPGHGDLAACLERVLQNGGPPALPEVSIQEIDALLAGIASRCRFSNPDVRAAPHASTRDLSALCHLVHRMHPSEAKWLIRLVLKDHGPVQLDEMSVMTSVHFLLPDILRFQQDFTAAALLLKGPLKDFPSCPDQQSKVLLSSLVGLSLKPTVGIKVSRPDFVKARSINHCLQMTGKRRWMIERKYDGEYCEMHIDLSRGDDWLRIFSKSGKESTDDRKALKHTLRKCLQIGRPTCKVKQQCILLGEMLVYSDQTRRILPFHKIRKHVTRSGVSLGTDKDSQPHDHEHLLIVFFDLLLLDPTNVMNQPIEKRKALLNSLYKRKDGYAITAESKVLDFADETSKRKLMANLASSAAARHEGLVLKPCGVPYFSLPSMTGQTPSYVIKLKKDYIDGLGDEADFAVIGASHDAQEYAKAPSIKVRWTYFHLGCLTNKDEVKRFHQRPCFKMIGTISMSGCIPPPVLLRANELARAYEESYDKAHQPTSFDLDAGTTSRMDVAFREPFVFEVLGSSFDKASNTDFWMLRHARVKRLHQDRTWQDCISFEELQDMARAAVAEPPDGESQENLRWMDKVERSCKRKIDRASCNTTPQTKSTTSPRSTRISPRGNTVSPKGVPQMKSTTSPTSTRTSPRDNTVSPKDVPQMMQPSSSPPSPPIARRRALAELDQNQVQKLQAQTALPTPPTSSPPGEGENNALTLKRKEAPGPLLSTSSKRACQGQKSAADDDSNHKTSTVHDSLGRPHLAPFDENMHRDSRTYIMDHIDPNVHRRGSPAKVMNRLPVSGAIPEGILHNARTLPGTCLLSSQRANGAKPECAMTNAVIYIDPLLSSLRFSGLSPTPATVRQMARTHGADIVRHLEEWDRDSYACAALTDLVSESQSHAGLRKVVITDEQNVAGVDHLVSAMLELNERDFRERIELWDWKALASCLDLHEGTLADDDVSGERFVPESGEDGSADDPSILSIAKNKDAGFVGATVWNEDRGTRFVVTRRWSSEHRDKVVGTRHVEHRF